jgi:bifunctional non-homologous end joining protein LigD
MTPREIALTNLDRVLWPSTGTTKGDLVAYYRDVAPVLVPHLRDRPLMLGRWPEGMGGRGWGQLECRGRPSWMATYPLRLRTGEVVDVCLANDVESLVWLAQQGVVELHAYLMRADAPELATVVVFDLDPGLPAGLRECASVALLLRDRLAAQGLVPVVKTSGAHGLHVVAAVRGTTFAQTKAFARGIAREMTAAHPALITDRMARDERAGKVFIDWGQNDANKSTIAPYSLRATRWPGASMPLRWEEVRQVVETGDESLVRFGPADALARIDSYGDLFREAAAGCDQRLL